MINLSAVALRAKKLFVQVSVVYFVLNLLFMVEVRIPPYSQGTCMATPQNPAVTLKVVENHFLGAYSTIEFDNIVQKVEGDLPYVQLRMVPFKKVKCNE